MKIHEYGTWYLTYLNSVDASFSQVGHVPYFGGSSRYSPNQKNQFFFDDFFDLVIWIEDCMLSGRLSKRRDVRLPTRIVRNASEIDFFLCSYCFKNKTLSISDISGLSLQLRAEQDKPLKNFIYKTLPEIGKEIDKNKHFASSVQLNFRKQLNEIR